MARTADEVASAALLAVQRAPAVTADGGLDVAAVRRLADELAVPVSRARAEYEALSARLPPG